MTVAEVIAKLQTMPQDLPVIVEEDRYYYVANDVRQVKDPEHGEAVIVG